MTTTLRTNSYGSPADRWAEKVKRANREFYDAVGPRYEDIDGRRSDPLAAYLSRQLDGIAHRTDADSILDLGCGSGFVSRVAAGRFRKRYAMDISLKILRCISEGSIHAIGADCDSIPVKDSTLSCVVTFSVLHHCYSHREMIAEIFRVLKPGGIYYSDHDMDSLFYGRFRFPLWLYRRLGGGRKRYLSGLPEIPGELYDLSEYHGRGVDSAAISSLVREIGFREARIDYHWFGLSPLTDAIFRTGTFSRGNAPLVRILAVR